MLFAILAIWFGYKKARDTGRNAFLWAAICGGAFVGIQLLVGIGAAMFIELGVAFAGWSEGLYEKYTWLISFIAIVFSFGGLLLIFRYLDRVPVIDEPYEPPPPPTFDTNE